jgi:hypothetical protein
MGLNPVKQRLPLGLWQTLALGVAAALALGTLYYGVSLAHESVFNDERAFRVLGDVSTQFKSLETSRATILRTMPDGIKSTMPACLPEGNREFQKVQIPEWAKGRTDTKEIHAKIREKFEAYLSKLDIVEARLCRSEADAGKPAPPSGAALLCKDAQPGEVIFHVNGDRLTTEWCRQDEGVYYSLEEPFYKAARHFISQDFFSETLLTLFDGTVLGEFPASDTATAYSRVSLQHSVADTVNIFNAHGLIRTPAQSVADLQPSAASDSSSAPRSWSGSSRQPIAFNQSVGPQNYRVYALPFAGTGNFVPDLPAGAAADKNGEQLNHAFYVVGLRRLDVSNTIFHVLWPIGLGLLTLLIPLSVLAWPLVKLELGPASESVSRAKAVICVLAAILIPVFLIVAAASLWSYFELEAWSARNSESYADTIDRTIRQTLVDGAGILNTYSAVFDGQVPCEKRDPWSKPPSGQEEFWDARSKFKPPSPDKSEASWPLLGYDNGRHPIYAELADSGKNYIACSTVQLSASPTKPPELDWSPFRNVLALDAGGSRIGPVLTAFKPVDVKLDLNLGSREYFQALKAGEAWLVSDDAGHSAHVVAQRLFNRSDASKTLQLAISRCDPQGRLSTSFCGIISGDLRMHNFLISEPPPLTRFAVIDTQTGTVVFHSDDSHSLAENFFLESELAPLLSAAIGAKQATSYSGRYIGDPHNFYYKPIAGTPWSVVVFFPEKDLADLPLRAGSAAISAYIGAALALLMIAAVARWLWCDLLFPDKPHGSALERLWPKPPLAPWYFKISRWHPSLWAVAALLTAAILGVPTGWAAIMALAVLVIAALPPFLLKKRNSRKSRELPPPIRREQAFVEVHASLLFVISIIPAYLLFASFSQLQFQGLVRDELARTAHQMERRFDLIRTDLQHWAPSTPDWKPTQYPTLWTLVTWPNLGISGSREETTAVSGASTTEPRISVFAKLIWESIADSTEQRRRLGFLAGGAADTSNCALFPKRYVERCSVVLFGRTPGTVWIKLPRATMLLSAEFDWFWPRFCTVVLAFALAWFGTRLVCRLLTRGLIGLNASYMPLSSIAPAAGDSAGESGDAYTANDFHAMWAPLSRPEKLLLYQLALHRIVNPRNAATVELLLEKKGLIRIDPFPKIQSVALEQLIRGAETSAQFEELQSTATKGTWKTVGPPLFIVLMVVIAWLSWSAGGTMKAVSAILLATVAFLGQMSQLIAMVRSGFMGTPKGGDSTGS